MFKRTTLIFLTILSLLAGQIIAVPAFADIAVDHASLEHGHDASIDVSVEVADSNEGKAFMLEGCDTVCGGCGVHHHLAQVVLNDMYLCPPETEPRKFSEETAALSGLIYDLSRPPKS